MGMVWLTRTEPGASRQATVLREHGYTPLVWPVIEAVEVQPPRLLQNGQPLADERSAAQILRASPRMVIALSAHAVRAALKQRLLASVQHAVFVAVGAQTAAQFGEVSASVVTPVQATSEGVLALPLTAELSAGDVVWVLAGEGGREVVAQHLFREYGATVVKFELYRRQQRPGRPVEDAGRIGAVVIGSQQGLQAFAQLWREMSGGLSIPLVVPSSRVAAAAREAGFTDVHTANGADNEAVLDALQDIKEV